MKLNDYLEITNEDNMGLMKRFSDNHFDLAIVDPPYGIKRSGQTETFTKKRKHKRKYHEQKNWDAAVPDAAYWNELFRVSKNQIVWGGNYFAPFLKKSMGWIFWDKGQDLSMSDGELAYTSFQRALRRIIINRSELAKQGTIHPTEKPIKLYQWLFKNYAKKGDKILDTHLGSGSIAIALHNMNERDGMDLTLTACELDKDYYEASIKRIRQQIAQKTIFST